jgi:hypothetical protein
MNRELIRKFLRTYAYSASHGAEDACLDEIKAEWEKEQGEIVGWIGLYKYEFSDLYALGVPTKTESEQKNYSPAGRVAIEPIRLSRKPAPDDVVYHAPIPDLAENDPVATHTMPLTETDQLQLKINELTVRVEELEKNAEYHHVNWRRHEISGEETV